MINIPLHRPHTPPAAAAPADAPQEAPPHAAPTSTGGQVIEKVLPNGVRLLVEPRPGARTATFAVGVASGAVHEAKSGTAHLFEHLAFQQTPSRPGNRIETDIARLGDANAYTDYTRILYHITVPTHSAKEGQDLITDIYLNPSMAPEDLAEQQGVVTQELRQRSQRNYQAYEETGRLLMGDQPLSGDQGGSVSGVKSATVDDLKQYIGRYFVGNNTVAMYSGDPNSLDLDRIEQSIGQLPAGEKLDKSTTFQGFRPGSFVELVPDESTSQVEVIMAFPAVAESHPAAPAVKVLANVLGGSAASVLAKRITDKEKLTSDVWSYNEMNPYYGSMWVGGAVEPGKVGSLVRSIADELKKLDAGKLKDELVDVARRQTANSMRLEFAKPGAVAMDAVEGALEDQAFQPIDERVAAIQALTPDQIKEAAAALIDWENVKIVARGPIDDPAIIQSALDEAGVEAKLEVVPFDQQRYDDRLHDPTAPVEEAPPAAG